MTPWEKRKCIIDEISVSTYFPGHGDYRNMFVAATFPWTNGVCCAPPPIDPTKAAAKNIFVSVLAILFDFAFNVHSNMYSNKILGSISPSQVAILQVYTQQRNSLFSNLIPGSLFSNYYFCKNLVLCTVYLSFFEYLPCIYKSLLPLTDTRDTVPHAHRAVHRCGQLVS